MNQFSAGCIADVETTEKMYALYSLDRSCAKVASAFKVSAQSVYGRFKRQGLKLRPSSQDLAFPPIVFNGFRYAANKDNYFRKTTGDRALLHHDMWEKAWGPVKNGWEVRFKDRNRMNVVLDNLFCVEIGDGRNLGKKFSLKRCLQCGEDMPLRLTSYESPWMYEKRRTCNAVCSGNWKCGKKKGMRMPKGE